MWTCWQGGEAHVVAHPPMGSVTKRRIEGRINILHVFGIDRGN